MVTGIAQRVQTRRGHKGRDDLLLEVEPYDGSGNPLPTIPVLLSSHRGGRVNDGEEVEVTGTWASGTVQGKTLFNLSTGSEITSGPRWEYIALAGLAALLLVLLITIYAMTGGL